MIYRLSGRGMATQEHALVDRATRAACAAAHRFGIRDFTPVVLGGYSNTLVRIAPHPIVARVATLASTTRDCASAMAREIAVGLALAQEGAASVRPSNLLPPGPHEEQNLWLSFWTHLNTKPERATPFQAGQQLRALHESLAQTGIKLPHLTPFYEGQAIVADHPGRRLDVEARRRVVMEFEVVRQRIEGECGVQPLHGDAHYGNLMLTDKGCIWGDLEDTCSGPVEWDLACLTASSRVFGRGRAASEALAGYGRQFDQERLDLMIRARVLQAVSWALVALPDPAHDLRLLARLRWLFGSR